MYNLGSIVQWNSPSDLQKSQKKLMKKHPDYLLVVTKNTSTYGVVPCWIEDPGYTICIFATPRNLYIDTKKIVTVKDSDIKLCEDYILKNTEDALHRVTEKNQELREKKHLAKMERVARKEEARKKAFERKRSQKQKYREHKEKIEKTYGQKYEVAVINNDWKQMKNIEKKVGYDPRPKLGGGKGSNLKDVRNPKPCVGGRVSPK